MPDLYQNVDTGDTEFLETVVEALERRAADPTMIQLTESYLDRLDFPDGGLHVEIGAGTGPVARRVAARAPNGRVVATDPSEYLVSAGKRLASSIDNLSFEVADGACLRVEDSSADNVIMHTVLTHVADPNALLTEAVRVLRPGGRLVVCDGCFETVSIANFLGDPLQGCADFFVQRNVTNKYLGGLIRQLVADAGLRVETFEMPVRVFNGGALALRWVEVSSAIMVREKLIGAGLGTALVEEYHRREANGTLLGRVLFMTLVARSSSGG
jgi:arsenite methyltransferase